MVIILATCRLIFSNQHIVPGDGDVGAPARGSDEGGRQSYPLNLHHLHPFSHTVF